MKKQHSAQVRALEMQNCKTESTVAKEHSHGYYHLRNQWFEIF